MSKKTELLKVIGGVEFWKGHCHLCHRPFAEVGTFPKAPYKLGATRYLYAGTRYICSHCEAIQRCMAVGCTEPYIQTLLEEGILQVTRGGWKPTYPRNVAGVDMLS